MTRWMKDFMKNKRKAAVSLLAVVLVGVMGISLFNNQTINTYALETTVETDASTQDSWTDYKKDSTQYTGRIWTDKSVSKDDVTLEGDSALTIEKSENSDFLVSLSALSSASTLVTTTTTPLDIVLVLDVSGSMDQNLGTAKEYRKLSWNYNSTAYDSRNNLYIRNSDGTYTKVTVSRTGNIFNRVYTYSAQGYETVRSEGANSSIPAPYYDNLYTYSDQSVTKIQGLKTAVDNFLTLTDNANASITDESKKHEVALIKFANDTYADKIGNNRSGGENYTQVVSDFTDDMSALSTSVNDLRTGGATSADYGLNLANIVINGGSVNPDAGYWDDADTVSGARKDSKKVVIFFTDGDPNHYNGFDGEVANEAISQAGFLKSNGTLIYSIGVFADADPSDIGSSTVIKS